LLPVVTHFPLPTFAASISSAVDLTEDDINFEEEEDDEVSRYLKEPIMDTEIDALKWWKKNSGRFPKLAKIAKDVLSVPASTLASEAAFSLSGRVITDFRANLAPETVSMILMQLKSWMDAYSIYEWKTPYYNIK
jgi:hypothetical protein